MGQSQVLNMPEAHPYPFLGRVPNPLPPGGGGVTAQAVLNFYELAMTKYLVSFKPECQSEGRNPRSPTLEAGSFNQLHQATRNYVI